MKVNYNEYYVSVSDGSGKVETIMVGTEVYYSLNVSDKIYYRGNIVSSSHGK